MAVAMATLAIGVALARPRELRVTADDARAHRFLRSFGAGFVRQTVTGRWSGPQSTTVLHGVGAGAHDLVLEISGGMPGRPQSFSLAPVGGARAVVTEPATFVVNAGGRQEYHVRLVVAQWPPSLAPIELALRTTPYRRGADGSELGVRLVGFSVRPAGGALARLASALPVAGTWGWALALGAVLALRAGARFTVPAVAGRRVAVAVAAAGLLLCALAWDDPHRFAWLLPPIPVACTFLSAALCVSAAGRIVRADMPVAPARWAALAASAALVVLYLQRGGAAPASILLAAALALLVLRPTPGTAADTGESRISTAVVLGLAVVAVAALAMRFISIREIPYGLWRDDARYGLVALRMIEDPHYRPAYVPEVVSLPGLGLRMLGLGLQVWGIATWSMRTVPALAGALTAIVLFGLARRLTARPGVALLAAAFLAVSCWHVTVSRITSPAAIHPLFEIAGLWCLAEGWGIGRRAPPRRGWRVILLLAGGALIGLSLQTYHSGRSSPLVAAALFAAYWKARQVAGGRWRDVLCAAAGFAIAAAPLLAYAWTDSQKLNARAGVVFLPRAAVAEAIAPLAALDASLGRHLLMFNVRGDFNGRRNVPLRPMLDPVAGLGFLAGLLACWRRRAEPVARFLLGALVLALLPSALAIEGPHSLRAIGAAGFACLIAAIGWRSLADGLAPRTHAVVLAAAAATSLALNAWTYFMVAARDERVWGAFYTVEARVGSFVRDRADRDGPAAAARVHVSREMADHSVVEFLVHGLPVGVFDDLLTAPPAADAVFVVARDGDRERLFAIAAERALGTPRLAAYGPPLPNQLPAFTLYRLP